MKNTNHTATLTPSAAHQRVAKMLKADLWPLLVGTPGQAKTATLTAAAKSLGWDVLFLHPATGDPTDVGGMPARGEDGKWSHAAIGVLREILECERDTLVIIDDLGQATPAMQGALMQLIHGGCLNGHRIPSCVRFAAATNSADDMAGVSGVIEPLKSRFASILHIACDAEGWRTWAAQNNLPPTLCAFISFSPDTLHGWEPSRELVNSPCPRTLERMGRLIDAGLTDEVTLAGAVGIDTARAYAAFARLAESGNLPSIPDILASPDDAPLPSEVGERYAVLALLARKVLSDADSLPPVTRYLARLGKEHRTWFWSDLVARKPEIANTPEYIATRLEHETTGNLSA